MAVAVDRCSNSNDCELKKEIPRVHLDTSVLDVESNHCGFCLEEGVDLRKYGSSVRLATLSTLDTLSPFFASLLRGETAMSEIIKKASKVSKVSNCRG